MPTPYIIPFFISHAGCPHQCVFCNQHDISGASQQRITPEQIISDIRAVLTRPRNPERIVQVAFYGGSFTGLELDAQRELLTAVQPFLATGQVQDIRVSTRPDCLDPERLQLLLDHGVSMVELGVQSLDPVVLKASGRGHDAQQVAVAFALLKQFGLQVGGQMMVGLPGDTPRKSMQTCRTLIGLRPDNVRIYPTLVMQHTPLQRLYQAGTFKPWSLAKTVLVVAQMKKLFAEARIPVIRMGLQAGESLQENMIAGPYHPAFGELVLSRLFFKQVRGALCAARGEGADELQLLISPRDHSLFMGMKKENYQRLQRGGWLDGVELILSDGQPRFTVTVQ